MNQQAITVHATIKAPLSTVWQCWNNPKDISGWAFASDDWEASGVDNNLREGRTFKTVMSAKDKSTSFDFTGTYTAVKEHECIEYDMDDKRHVKVTFKEAPDGVQIVETFDPETINAPEVQRGGWQAILDNFKTYVEAKQ